MCVSDDSGKNDGVKEEGNETIANGFHRLTEKDFVATCMWYSPPSQSLRDNDTLGLGPSDRKTSKAK